MDQDSRLGRAALAYRVRRPVTSRQPPRRELPKRLAILLRGKDRDPRRDPQGECFGLTDLPGMSPCSADRVRSGGMRVWSLEGEGVPLLRHRISVNPHGRAGSIPLPEGESYIVATIKLFRVFWRSAPPEPKTSDPDRRSFRRAAVSEPLGCTSNLMLSGGGRSTPSVILRLSGGDAWTTLIRLTRPASQQQQLRLRGRLLKLRISALCLPEPLSVPPRKAQ